MRLGQASAPCSNWMNELRMPKDAQHKSSGNSFIFCTHDYHSTSAQTKLLSFLSVKKCQNFFNCSVYSSIQCSEVWSEQPHEKNPMYTIIMHTTANSRCDGQKSPKESGSDIKRHTYTKLALHVSCTSGRIDLAVSQSRSVVSKGASHRVIPTGLGRHMQHVQNTGDCYIKTLLLGAAHEIKVRVILFVDGMMAGAEEKALSNQQMLSDTMGKIEGELELVVLGGDDTTCEMSGCSDKTSRCRVMQRRNGILESE